MPSNLERNSIYVDLMYVATKSELTLATRGEILLSTEIANY